MLTMQPKFDNYESGYGSELLCPRCGTNYMHHEKVDIFERSEDAKTGLRVSVSNSKASIDTSLEGNPSARRDGLIVTLWCENCHCISELSIAQHKGQTYVDLLDTGEDMKSPSIGGH